MKIGRWEWMRFAIASALTCQFAISACSAGQTTEQTTLPESPNVAGDADPACDPMAAQVPLQPATDIELPFERFNFRPTEIEATDTTLTFKGARYSFTLCKRDRTWGIQAVDPIPETEADYADYLEALQEPDYETTTSQAQTYQARVRLDASWLDSANPSDDSLEQVIFDLIKPGTTEPLSTVLYTNTDIIERELGASAGVPTVTRTLVTDDALWWSIGFEQGEGASGIATVVQYDIATDNVIVWQPSQLGNAQITDLAITSTDNERTLWLGTQYSGEGNPYLPAKGLVAYRPADDQVQTYTVDNSPLVGAIPTRLWSENNTLWVATSSGVCAVDWATIEANDSWNCWRFTTMAEIPDTQALYASLLSETPLNQSLDTSNPIELLWLADTDISTPESANRYEIKYEPGITAQLSQGAEYYVGPEETPDDGYFWWPGQDWSWNGKHFVRYWDQVAVNYVGGGPQGIGPSDYENYVVDWQTMRGEFELLALTEDTTEIKYYSVWIDATEIEPWVTVTNVTNAPLDTPNPTEAVLTKLKEAAQ